MNPGTRKPKVFISHSSKDTWIAKQIAAQIEANGADTFLDEADIQHGDDFEQRILEAADDSTELLVLLTPWSTSRPYIWLEIGVFWGGRKRMVGILHGIEAKDLATDERIPIALKRLDLVDLNNIESYFSQLQSRVNKWEAQNG
ncbi:MAG TPA: toll/interleukin-1 receptor domain-containing protein [Pyrinomonadaceae bacterium]|jgi:hypothetical protein